MKTEQQLKNLRDALVWWQTVPAKNVIRGLEDWRREWPAEPITCDTVACFGGWCAVHPSLMAQGVHPKTTSGAPIIGDESGLYKFGSLVAQEIFGDGLMFKARLGHPADKEFAGSDHALVTNRIRWALDQHACEVGQRAHQD